MAYAENSLKTLDAVCTERADEMKRLWQEIRRRVGA